MMISKKIYPQEIFFASIKTLDIRGLNEYIKIFLSYWVICFHLILIGKLLNYYHIERLTMKVVCAAKKLLKPLIRLI